MDAPEISTAAVIGAGVMGSAIAQVLAMGGCRVQLHDISQEALDSAMQKIEHGRFGLRRGVELGKVSPEQVGATLDRLVPTTDFAAACAGVDLVIEAVFEDLALKIEVFRKLDAATPGHAILASNTSGFPCAALAAATDRPERVIVWHWFQPATVMKLAEIVVHKGTAPETTEAIVALARRCGKNPQVVKDTDRTWGFVGNRINRAARQEAQRIVAEGIATEEQVDAIMRDGFRWPMGPFGRIPK